MASLPAPKDKDSIMHCRRLDLGGRTFFILHVRFFVASRTIRRLTQARAASMRVGDSCRVCTTCLASPAYAIDHISS